MIIPIIRLDSFATLNGRIGIDWFHNPEVRHSFTYLITAALAMKLF
jgi:hypothetical protein